MARDLENRVALRREGLIDPAAETQAAHESRPLAAHLDDFERDLLAKGATAKHAKLFTDRARRVAALVGGAKPPDIDRPHSATRADRARAAALARVLESARLSSLTASRVQTALATLRDHGRSLATCNHHRAAIRGFSRWAWKDGRLRDHP